MFIHLSPYLDYDLYRDGYPRHIHQDGTIECSEQKHLNTHIRVPNSQFETFELPHCHWEVQVAFETEMASVLVYVVIVSRTNVHPCPCASNVSAGCFWCQFGKEGIRL